MPGEPPLPDREAWQAAVYRVAKSGHYRSAPAHTGTRHFFACGSSAPVRVEREGGAAAWLAGTLGRQVCRDTDSLCPRSNGPIRAFFQASCSGQSEGLFGQCLSIALPTQALRGLLCLGSFSVVLCIRHIEGAPSWVLLCRSACQALKGAHRVGFYPVAQSVRPLTGQPLYSSAAKAGVWRERGFGGGSTRYV